MTEFTARALVFTLGLLLMEAAQPAPVVIAIHADDNYPPYSFVENGRLTGIYTMIVQKALERLPEYQVELVAVPWRRGLAQVENGQAFAIYPPYYRPDERPHLRYSEPILTEQVVVFCNAAAAAKRQFKHWPGDYHGLRIGVNSGFLTGGSQFETAVRAGLLTADSAQGNRANVLKLLRGRVDCYINDRLSILWELERMKAAGLVDPRYQAIVETTIVGGEQGYLGYTGLQPERYPFRDDFIQKFNAAIREMRRSGEIKDITTRFLNH